jgi:hypothetical protein
MHIKNYPNDVPDIFGHYTLKKERCLAVSYSLQNKQVASSTGLLLERLSMVIGLSFVKSHRKNVYARRDVQIQNRRSMDGDNPSIINNSVKGTHRIGTRRMNSQMGEAASLTDVRF